MNTYDPPLAATLTSGSERSKVLFGEMSQWPLWQWRKCSCEVFNRSID